MSARAAVGLPNGFRFYELRHTASTPSGSTLKDRIVRGPVLREGNPDLSAPRRGTAVCRGGRAQNIVRAERVKTTRRGSQSSGRCRWRVSRNTTDDLLVFLPERNEEDNHAMPKPLAPSVARRSSAASRP